MSEFRFGVFIVVRKELVKLLNNAELVFAGGDSNTNLILRAHDDASYTLTLPYQVESSGSYMKVDGSGNLYLSVLSSGVLIDNEKIKNEINL